jgi:two-component system, LytTR family, sensor kinase
MHQARWYNKKALIVMLHISTWLLLFGLPILLRQENPNRPAERSSGLFGYIIATKYVIWAALFYFNAYFIVPRIIYKRRLWAYILSLVAIFAILFVVDSALFHFIMGWRSFILKNFLSFNLFPILFVLTASTAFRMVSDRIKEDRIKAEKVTENLKTELSLLRSQVSPHFMFNIMNNMVALARKKSDLLEPSLIKLSSLLRYMLYETDEKVPLQKEIEYLQSYIDLQRQRFGKNVEIKTCMQQASLNYEIEPMLLIPFVENAFKHGTGMIENAEIDIDLKVERDILTFSVHNKFSNESAEIKDKSSGIGLTNVRRRLDLLYGDKHTLLITKREQWFIVSLQIALV